MSRLTYTTSISIVIHNEYYTNKGLSQKEMIGELKQMEFIGVVKPFPINDEIEVKISQIYTSRLDSIMYTISATFDDLLDLKENNGK